MYAIRSYYDLADNAIKFCDRAVVQIAIGYRRTEDGMHELSIADNGVGLPGEEYERIFEEFYQVEKYFTGNVSGVGLGLSLVRRLIRITSYNVCYTKLLRKQTYPGKLFFLVHHHTP